VHLDVYGLHRDPAQFPEPLVFRPERWLDKDSAEAQARHPNAWQGFGSGARMCLGYKLATMELVQVRGRAASPAWPLSEARARAGRGGAAPSKALAPFRCAAPLQPSAGRSTPNPVPTPNPQTPKPPNPQSIATLYQKFTFELDPARTKLDRAGLPAIKPGIFMHYDGGVFFRVHQRPGEPAAAAPAAAAAARAAAAVVPAAAAAAT
jgi:hypothetical protein